MENRDDKIRELLESGQKEEKTSDSHTDGAKKESKNGSEKKSIFDSIKDTKKVTIAKDTISEKIFNLRHNKKALIAIAAVAVILAGYYLYSNFLKAPTYTTLPNINIQAQHRSTTASVRHKTVKNKKTDTNKANSSTQAKNISKYVPALQTPNIHTNINQLVKKNTKAIVEATQEQEKQLFDIFKIEPEQEYKIDRLIDLAKKQNAFLAVEEAILQKKTKIEKLLDKLQQRNNKETQMQEKINTLINEVSNLKAKISNTPVKQFNPKYKLSKNNPFPIPLPKSPVEPKNTYVQELNNLSVGIIYNYKGDKVAVVNNGGRVFRVGIGGKVTEHFIIKDIKNSGIVVATSMKSKGIFIPLSLSIGKTKTIFGTVNRKSETAGPSSGASSPYSSSSSTNQQAPMPSMGGGMGGRQYLNVTGGVQ